MSEEKQVPATNLPPKLDLRKIGVLPAKPRVASPETVAPALTGSDAGPATSPATAADAVPTRPVPPARPGAGAVPSSEAPRPTLASGGSLSRPTMKLRRPAQPGEESPAQPPAAPVSLGGSSMRATGSRTIRMSIPSEGAIAQDAAAISPAEPSLPPAETVSAPEATPVTGPAVLPSRTVQVRRPMPLPRKDDVMKPAGSKPSAPRPGDTSPIPIDQIAAAPGGTTPKTIRLKRPMGAGVGVRAPEEAPSNVEVSAPAAEEGPATAAPEEMAAVSDEDPATRKKTIKVKRPDRSGRQAKPISIARQGREGVVMAQRGAATGIPTEADLLAEAAEQNETESGPAAVLTVLSGVAAVMVACVLIYVIAAQAFPQLGFSWPGQIQ